MMGVARAAVWKTDLDEAAAKKLLEFLETSRDAPEVLWSAGVAMMQRSLDEAREAKWSRFRFYPRGQLRTLRRDLAEGLKLAHLAVTLQETENDVERDLNHELREAAAAAGKARRRAQTLPAQEARLANARRRKLEAASTLPNPPYEEAP